MRDETEYLNALLYTAPNRTTKSFKHPDHAELIVLIKGQYTARWRQGTDVGAVSASRHDVVLWPPGTYREEQCPAGHPMKAYCVYFRWLHPPAHLPVRVVDRRGVILVLAEVLLVAKDLDASTRGPLIRSYLNAMLAEYQRLAAPGRTPLATRVAQYTESHLRERIRVRSLARAMGLEACYFARRYKAMVGSTPMADVRRIKAEHARGILRGAPELPLKDVATRVGASSIPHLCRLLKTTLGLTARELRAASPSRPG